MTRSGLWPNAFENLPVEVICHIFDNLEMQDLLACSTVTKHLRIVIAHSSRLQYTIDLDKHRMVSLLPPSGSLPFAARLKLIRERERAWKYMDWKKKHTLKLPPTGSVYEFVGGLYANGREDDSRITASISFLELPSTDEISANEPEKELEMWTHAMEDINIIDFTMDPSQDLLVLVALAPPDSTHVYELHLRSIKTNQPHPKAPLSILPCWQKLAIPLPSSDVVAAVRIQISGNLVALLIKEVLESNGAHLEIWNWEKNSQFSCAMTRTSGIDDFTFLTQDTFLLVRPAGQFEVYTFIDPSRRCSIPHLRITYSFPPLSPGYMYWYISMSSNPAPGYVPRPSTDSGPRGAMPSTNKQIYYPRPEERIHACCLYIFEPANEENTHVHSFVFFLNLQTLLNPPAEWVSRAQALSLAALAKKRQKENGSAREYAQANSSTTSSSPLSTFEASDESIFHASSQTSSPPISFSNLTTYNSTIPPMPSYPPFPTFDNASQTTSTGPAFNARRNQASFAKAAWNPTSATESGRRNRTLPAQSSITSIPPNTTIPWDIWGSQSTRWFEECINTDWQHAIYGLRTVESLQPNPRFGEPIPAVSIPTEVKPPFMSPENGSSTSTSAQTTKPPLLAAMMNGTPSTDFVDANNSQNQLIPLIVAAHGEVQATNVIHTAIDDQEDSPVDSDGVLIPRRYLRVRDFNPYIFANEVGAVIEDQSKSKEKQKSYWVEPRLVTEPSTTPAKGVFAQDVVSSLPYMEVISREPFEVTDVMMDDCRLLLLKRARSGKLKRVDVLML